MAPVIERQVEYCGPIRVAVPPGGLHRVVVANVAGVAAKPRRQGTRARAKKPRNSGRRS